MSSPVASRVADWSQKVFGLVRESAPRVRSQAPRSAGGRRLQENASRRRKILQSSGRGGCGDRRDRRPAERTGDQGAARRRGRLRHLDPPPRRNRPAGSASPWPLRGRRPRGRDPGSPPRGTARRRRGRRDQPPLGGRAVPDLRRARSSPTSPARAGCRGGTASASIAPTLEPDEIRLIDAIPLTSPARTLFDLGTMLGASEPRQGRQRGLREAADHDRGAARRPLPLRPPQGLRGLRTPARHPRPRGPRDPLAAGGAASTPSCAPAGFPPGRAMRCSSSAARRSSRTCSGERSA